VLRLAGLIAVLTAAVLAPAGATGASAPVSLKLDYRVPPRYGLDRNHDGLVDSISTAAEANPSAWTALVTVRWPNGGSCDGRYAWTVGGRPKAFVQQRDPATGRPTCTFAFDGFPALDHPYRVRVAATRAGVRASGRLTVTVRDLLVVGLGDSIASGEGNPDSAISPVRWQDRRCHRSARSFEALAAGELEAASDGSSVTFVSLACSGASISAGMLGGYAGIEPTGSGRLPPQMTSMQALVGTRTPDAVLVSIGINDLGFGNVAFFCFDDGVDAAAAAKTDCWNRHYPTAASPTTLRSWVRARAAALTGRYAQLAVAFQRAGIPAARIYVTEYPNATRDSQGKTCDPLIPYLDSRPFGYTLRGSITREEAAQAESELLVPVNRALRAAATKYGWHLVSGIAAASATHGLCAAQPWFVSVYGSLIGQHDAFGTLHPNAQGQQATADRVVAALARRP
jgi:lysophospholipase L1-like esterase